MITTINPSLWLRALLTLNLLLAPAWAQSATRLQPLEPSVVHKGVMVLEDNRIGAEGKADYMIEATGRLFIKGYAEAPVLRIQPLKFDETYNVAPENLLSSHYQKLGNTIPFDRLVLKITAVDPTKQLSTAEGKNRNGKVLFIVDTSRKMIDLHRVSLTSRVIPVPLKLKRVS
jgi:hypothetical protein